MNLLDTVALLVSLPEWGLARSHEGVIIEQLVGAVFEVEFTNGEGRTYVVLALPQAQLLKLRHTRQAA